MSPRTSNSVTFTHRGWRRLHQDLAERGRGNRESAAFLLSRPENARIRAWIAYDDLDPTCLTGGISFSGARFADLWALCTAHGLRVIADIHTHPGPWVEQSPTDKAKPTIARVGHISLISPSYATNVPPASQVGVHLYQGNGRWHSVPSAERASTLRIGPNLWRTAALKPDAINTGHEKIGAPR